MLNSDRLNIDLAQVSLQFNDRGDLVDEDLDEVLGDRPRADFYGFTEASPGGHVRERLRIACKRHHLTLCTGPGDTAIATRHQVIGDGSYLVHPGRPGPARNGGHGPRYIDWVAARIEGERVFFHEAHWLTISRPDAARRLDHTRMTRAMVGLVSAHGVGRRLSFFAGDINVDEATDHGANHSLPDHLFNSAGLTTIWDELHRTPSTHGHRTIDVIGSYGRDGRVRAESAKVWPGLNSDHRQVTARYSVAQDR